MSATTFVRKCNWDRISNYETVLLLDVKEPDFNVNDERYSNPLKLLRLSVKNKRPGKWEYSLMSAWGY